jgi:hypothetical protein
LARYDNRDECEIAESLIDPDWYWEVGIAEVRAEQRVVQEG